MTRIIHVVEYLEAGEWIPMPRTATSYADLAHAQKHDLQRSSPTYEYRVHRYVPLVEFVEG